MNGCIYRTKDNECELWTVDKRHSFCDIETCKDRVMSNADRIRSMTDEELARFLSFNTYKHIDDFLLDLKDQTDITVTYSRYEEEYKKKITEWLKAEVQDV